MADVGLVVVSHSRALATAAVALAGEMLHGGRVRIEVAAGLDESTFGTDAFGTDAARIAEAVTAADRGDGVVVLMDLGSAVLSAELALELLDPDARERVTLCPAPMVEGLVVASVAAAGGAGPAEVAAEATGALAGKITQLAPPAPNTTHADDAPGADELTGAFTVTNAHGLHARPAARLVQALAGLDARARLRNRGTGSPWVPASSLSQLATLGALPGHEIEVRARGDQAREALDGVLALAARNFDEPRATAAATAPARGEPPAAPAGAHRPLAASPGIGIGPARTGRAEPVDVPDTPAEAPEVEWGRLTGAIAAARDDITRLRARTARDLGEADAAIFDAHLLLLDDTDLLDRVRSRIDGGQAAARAWAEAVDALRAALAALPDPYQQARAADVAAVGDQVLRALLGTHPTARPTTAPNAPAGVLVAATLTPAEAAGLDPATVTAVLLAFDSPTAHAAILLRAKGIPAVVAAGAGVLDIAEGTQLVVDGTQGTFEVDPPAERIHDYRHRADELAARAERALARAPAPARTRDGVEIAVGANIGSVEDAHAAARLGADLAGLVRTEFLFLGRSRPPDVDEQETIYRDIATALGGRRITLRTLDVGGDKPLPYLPTPAEANPYLGVRGIRLSLAHPELLTDQLLAIVRVARDTPVSLMFPMVATLDELLAARRLLDAAIARTGPGRPAGLEVGIMIEIPAAALHAGAFAPHVDFLSIGTNDLTQYALAADRNNDAVAALADPYHPGVLRLIDATCRGADEATDGRVTVAVCGELAADEPAATLLTGLGVRELSVAPPAVPATKEAVRALDTRHAAERARAALTAPAAPGHRPA